MNRRGFLGSILALGAAPAIVRADSLMRVVPTDTLLDYASMDCDLTLGAYSIEVVSAPSLTLQDIITTTIRARMPQMVENISRRNAQLARLYSERAWK